jgi:hypothetical protein
METRKKFHVVKSHMVFSLSGIIMLTFLGACDLFNTDDLISLGSNDANIAKVVVGRGYDISGRFAYSEEIKEPVLDFTQLVTDQKIVKDGNIAQTEVIVKEGNTISQYQVSFDYAHTGTAGVEGLFSAEVGYNFGYDRAKRSDYSYATVSSSTHKYGMYIDGRKSPSSLSGYATNQFLSDAASLNINEFVEKYGTHVIVGGIWGASLDFSMSAQRKSVSNTYSFGTFVKAEATIEGISLGGSTEISAEFSNYYEASTKKVTINAKGGNSEHALSIITAATPEGRDAAYAAWVGTINDNPAFCDYYEGGLVPVYAFIENADLQASVQAGVEAYLKSKGIDEIVLQETTIMESFDLSSFCMNVGQGDANIDADGKGDILIEGTIEIEIDMNNDLALLVELKVHEKKGDYTKIEGSIEKRLYTNKHINSIELAKPKFGFSIQQAFNPDNGQYIPLDPFLLATGNTLPKWLSQVMVCIDGRGNDENIIGIKGNLIVPVTILP